MEFESNFLRVMVCGVTISSMASENKVDSDASGSASEDRPLKRKATSGSFKPGDPNNPAYRKGQIRPPSEPRTDNEAGIPSSLAVMRWVNEQAKDCDATPAQKRMRAFADAAPARFMDKLQAAEESWAVKLAAASAPDPEADESPFAEMEEAWAKVLEWEKRL